VVLLSGFSPSTALAVKCGSNTRRKRVSAGSYDDRCAHPYGKSPDVVAQIESIYTNTPTPLYFRDHAEIARFFDGVVHPGRVADQRVPLPRR
jgi:hypothetical protein